MKTISIALAAHILQECTTLCTCWKVTLRDTTVMGFTDNTDDLVISGVTYKAATGYTPSAVQTSSALDVDNLELVGALDETAISAADLQAGRWDYARVEIFQANYKDLSMGTLPLRIGTLGQVTRTKVMFQAELRGLLQALSQSVGILHMPMCRHDLGDVGCKINLATFPDGTVSGSLTSVTSRLRITDTSLTQPAGWFDNGTITFTSGLNNGYARDIKSFPGSGLVILQEPLPFAAAVSDTYTILAGCLKRFNEDCIAKFNNAVNNGSFPHLPGMDRLVSGQ